MMLITLMFYYTPDGWFLLLMNTPHDRAFWYDGLIAKSVNVSVVKISTIARNVLEIELHTPQPLTYTAGQFIQLRLAGEWRAYSVADMPDAYTVKLGILLIDGGRASSVIGRLRVGDPLTMLPPDGWFTYGDHTGASCMIGTSTGIVPLYAMARDALQMGERQRISLLFGARSQNDLLYVDELTALAEAYDNFEVIYALSRPHPGWDGFEGRVSHYLRRYWAALQGRIYYVSAWHGVVELLEAQLLRQGVARSALYSEYYD